MKDGLIAGIVRQIEKGERKITEATVAIRENHADVQEHLVPCFRCSGLGKFSNVALDYKLRDLRKTLKGLHGPALINAKVLEGNGEKIVLTYHEDLEAPCRSCGHVNTEVHMHVINDRLRKILGVKAKDDPDVAAALEE